MNCLILTRWHAPRIASAIVICCACGVLGTVEAFGQDFTDADDFDFGIFGSAYSETVEWTETWDAISSGFTDGQNQNRYTINGDHGNALTMSEASVGGDAFPKLSNPDLNLGDDANTSGLDPRDGAIVLYSSVRLGVQNPFRGRIEISIGSGVGDSANDVHPRYTATNLRTVPNPTAGGVQANPETTRLVDQPLASEGTYGNPGFSQDAIEPGLFDIAGEGLYDTDANPFFDGDAFDATKYVHFATVINPLNTGVNNADYEILGFMRRDASSSWELTYRASEDPSDPLIPYNLGDIGADHPFIAGAKQGFVNSLGFVTINGNPAGNAPDPTNEVFYGRNAITQLNGSILPGDYNFDGSADGADFLAWQQGNSPNFDSETGTVSAADLDTWQQNYGAIASLGGVSSVPEPAAASLMLCATLLKLSGRRRQVVI